MAERLEIHQHKNNYRIDLINGRHLSYRNIIDRDPNKIAMILLDLYREGFPIEEAVKRFLNKITQKDWLGL